MPTLVQTREWPFASQPPFVRPLILALAGGTFGLLLTGLLNRFDPLLTVIGMSAVFGAALLLMWPALSMPLGIAVLYGNFQVLGRSSTALTLLITASWIVLLAFPLLHALIMRRTTPRVDAVFCLMLTFLTLQLISSLWAKDMSVALGKVLEFVVEGLLLYWLVFNLLRSARTLHCAIWAMVLTAAFLASLSTYQAVTHSYQQQFGGLAWRQLRYEEDEDAQIKASGGRKKIFRLADRAAGPVGDSNRYAQILLVVAPFAVYLVTRARSTRAKLVASGSALLIAGTVVLTYSRGAFLTFAVLLSLLVLWKVIRLSLVITVVVMLGVAAVIFAPDYAARIATIGTSAELGDAAGPQPDAAIRGRATEMLAALSVFLDHPVIGVGPGQYRPFYSEQYQASPDIAFRFLPREREAHSLFLGLAAEEGIVGVTIFVSILALLVLGLWQTRRYWRWRDPQRTALATAAILSVIAYLGTGLFLHLAFQRYFWLLVSVVSAARHLLVRDAWITERTRRAA